METLKSLLDDLRSLQEDASNTLDNSYSAARKIWESLPENERLLVSPRGNYVDSPNLIKRVVINGKGFADAYKYNGKDDIAFTVVAISPNCRGQGLSKQLITRLENELKRKGVKKIIHRAEKTNNASIGLAKSLGYQFDGETKHQVRFSKVLNESFKMGFDYSENLYELEKHCKTPEEFNKFLNKNFDYGYIKDGNIVKPEDDNFDFKDYRTLSLRDFLCYRLGVCWDYAEFEAWYFEEYLGYKMNYKSSLKDKEFSLYYIQIEDNNMCPSHTWLAYKDGSKVKLFESSWLKKQGIKTFDSEKEMVDYYRKIFKEYYQSRYKMILYKYKPLLHKTNLKGKSGLKAEKFMNIIYDTGTCIINQIHPEKEKLLLEDYYRIPYDGEETYEALNESEILNEALDFKVKLYHGSANKYKVLKAVSYNDGNRLQSKAWSIFFWGDKELAKRWSVFVSMMGVYREIRDKTGVKIGRPKGQHIKVGLNKYQYKIYVRQEDLNIYKNHLKNKESYVYTVELPFYNIGFGNNSFQPEYTYNGNVTPSKTESLKLTPQLLDSYCTIISDEMYSKLNKDSSELTKPIRGILNPLFGDSTGAIERWKHIYRKIHAGEAKPGDDIDKLLSDFKMIKESEVMNESVWNALSLKGGPHLTLYHGSPSKQDEIKPVSLTVGNSMHDPGWAVFMFDDKRLAMAYAVGITISTTYKDWFDQNKISPPIGWFENDKGLFKYKPVNIVDETVYDKIVNKVVGTKFYVYTLQVPIDKNLNMIGTTNTIPEYTYTGTPKVIKREEMVISKEVFDAQYAKVSHDVYEKYRAAKMAKKSLYGPWMKMFVNMDTRGTKRKLVLKTLNLEPGSDLSFLNDIIGKDDYHNNVSKWLEDKQKILYVFGLSGSGKTTMTNKLAKLLNCKVIHIDEVHHEMSKKIGKNWKNGSLTQQQRRDIVWNEVKKRAGDDKCIIEGGAMIVYKVEDLEKKPYIIPGTSVITSTFRMLKRTLSNDPKQGLPAFFKDYEGKSRFEMLKNMIRIIYNCAKGNIDMAGKFDAYKKN